MANKSDAYELVVNTPLHLQGVYSGKTLSCLLEEDATAARQLDAGELTYRLDDFARHAAQLELALGKAIEAMDEIATEAHDYEEMLAEQLDLNESLKKGGNPDALLKKEVAVWKEVRQLALSRIESAKEYMDEVSAAVVDAAARAEVERSLHGAGIIEDPDIDGGLNG